MDPITFNCRHCKKVVNGKIILEFTELLPPGLKCLMCMSCGILGIELLPDMPSDLRL